MFNQKAQDEIQKHYDKLIEMGYNVVGVFLYGSQNYELDYEGSDVDSKAIVLPTLNDIVLNKQPISTTIDMGDGCLCDVKDIRKMFECFKKQNINFVEILFTKYKIINPKYESFWKRLVDSNELIARYNNYSSVTCMSGMTLEKYKALEHPYPATMDKIEKYGYDPKQLHHIIRLNEFIKRYISGEAYKDCLISKNKEYLIEVKKGLHNLQEARELAKTLSDETNQLRKDYMSTNDIKVNKQVEDILNEVLVDIIKFNFKTELLGELK